MKIILDSTLKKKKISQYKLAKDTGIAASTLNNLCNNKTSSIQFSVLDKICDALDCEVSDIVSPPTYISFNLPFQIYLSIPS